MAKPKLMSGEDASSGVTEALEEFKIASRSLASLTEASLATRGRTRAHLQGARLEAHQAVMAAMAELERAFATWQQVEGSPRLPLAPAETKQ